MSLTMVLVMLGIDLLHTECLSYEDLERKVKALLVLIESFEKRLTCLEERIDAIEEDGGDKRCELYTLTKCLPLSGWLEVHEAAAALATR